MNDEKVKQLISEKNKFILMNGNNRFQNSLDNDDQEDNTVIDGSTQKENNNLNESKPNSNNNNSGIWL